MTSVPQNLTGAQPSLPCQQQKQVTCGHAGQPVSLLGIVLGRSPISGQRAAGIVRCKVVTWLLQRGGWQGALVLGALMLRPVGSKQAHRLQQAGRVYLGPSGASLLPAALLVRCSQALALTVCPAPHSLHLAARASPDTLQLTWQLSNKDAALLQLCWSV